MKIKDVLPEIERIKKDYEEMDLKDKTRRELERKIQQLEDKIHDKGVGSDYLKRAERVQRDVNLALILGAATAVLGLTAWTVYKYKGE